MTRPRKIKKIGFSYYIHLSPSDMTDFGMREGDVVDIDDLNLLQEAELIKLRKKLK